MFVRYEIDYNIFDETPVYKIFDKLKSEYVGGEYTDFDTVDEDCYILNEEWGLQ